jgi:hypothetical protein
MRVLEYVCVCRDREPPYSCTGCNLAYLPHGHLGSPMLGSPGYS